MTSILPIAVPNRGLADTSSRLPTWPVTVMFAYYPLWWVLGMADVAWILVGLVMALYLGLSRDARVPHGFGLWLAFILWMVLSLSQLDTFGRFVGFGYRSLHYVAATVVFVYIYNNRQRITDRFVSGALTTFWVITVAGGFLGMTLPNVVVRTPLSYVLPDSLINNELVGLMVVRRFAQYNPDGFVAVDPRPAAPFLYTNNWGNAYSLLLPFVALYLCKVWGERRFWWVAAAVPLSLIPAFATLNRGMFLGIALAGFYISFRYLLLGNLKVLVGIATIGVLTLGAATQLSVQDKVFERVEETSTTEDRAQIYTQTLVDVRESPLLGYGAPRPSANPNIPPVGTHGQFWIVLHSHGIPAVLFFMGFLTWCFLRSAWRRDPTGILSNTVILVSLAESFYYGFLPTGLYITLIACAVALRSAERLTLGEK